MRVINLSISD